MKKLGKNHFTEARRTTVWEKVRRGWQRVKRRVRSFASKAVLTAALMSSGCLTTPFAGKKYNEHYALSRLYYPYDAYTSYMGEVEGTSAARALATDPEVEERRVSGFTLGGGAALYFDPWESFQFGPFSLVSRYGWYGNDKVESTEFGLGLVFPMHSKKSSSGVISYLGLYYAQRTVNEEDEMVKSDERGGLDFCGIYPRLISSRIRWLSPRICLTFTDTDDSLWFIFGRVMIGNEIVIPLITTTNDLSSPVLHTPLNLRFLNLTGFASRQQGDLFIYKGSLILSVFDVVGLEGFLHYRAYVTGISGDVLEYGGALYIHPEKYVRLPIHAKLEVRNNGDLIGMVFVSAPLDGDYLAYLARLARRSQDPALHQIRELQQESIHQGY